MIVLLAALYGGVGWLVTSQMIGENPRWRGMNRGPADFGLAGETVAFPSTDGVSLKAWWLPAPGRARATVVIAHGIDHTRQVMLPRAAFLVHAGYNVLAVDLRGHGESAAQFVSGGFLEARDVLGAVRFLRQRGQREPIVLMGVSMGAMASLLAAADSSEIAAVIADGPGPSGRQIAENIRRHFVRDPRSGRLLRALFTAAALPGLLPATRLVYYARTGIDLGPDFVSVLPAASRIRVPVLLLSGERDWIVPTSQVRTILDALPAGSKSLVVLPGAQHDTTFSTAPALYSQAVLAFLDANLPR
ncbi:MAG: alpha/beta fold hydrolase [Terracidiphilus sp.]